jgi:hypothetical protein
MFGNPLLPMLLAFGVMFGALGAACAYFISYHEYRQRRLRPGESAQWMAAQTAAVTFGFFLVAAIVLAYLLARTGHSVE